MRCSGIRTVSEYFMNHHAFQPQLLRRCRDRSVGAPLNTAKGMGRGAALMLALFAMMVVGTTTLSYVASRETSSSIAANAQLAADARTLASSGMSIAKGILRSSETIWRRNHVGGVLLNNYSLDGGTVTVRLVDIVKRANPANGGNIFPDDATTEVEVTVSSTRGGATWSSVANMSIPSVVKGEYAIFANKIMIVDGSNNFIGRWPNAPMSAQKLRVNIGTQADLAFLSNIYPWFGSGVWLQGGCRFESEVAGSTPSDADSMKATWIYYPYSATGLIVQGATASSVAAKRMDPLDSIRMVNPPAPPSVGGTYSNYTNNYILPGGSYSLNSFRVRAVFLPQLFTKNFEVRQGATVTLNTGTYEVYGSWILRDSRIIINGDVKFVINPNLALTGLDWQNSSVEINPNSTLEIYNGYSMDVRNCWIGPRKQYICNSVAIDGDPHKKNWFAQFTSNDCYPVAPNSPQYMEPWRVRVYPMRQFLSSFFLWDIRDTSIVGSLFLPTNPIRLFGRTQVYGRVAANHLLIYDTASFFYDHALDLVTGFTEGRAPSRGGDPEDMFPSRIVSYGFNAEAAR
jgi:hypothetical protein